MDDQGETMDSLHGALFELRKWVAEWESTEQGLKLSRDALHEVGCHLDMVLSQLRAAQMQSVQRNPLLMLGKMASGVAHEFNNTLVPILGFT